MTHTYLVVNHRPTIEIYTLSLHDALPIFSILCTFTNEPLTNFMLQHFKDGGNFVANHSELVNSARRTAQHLFDLGQVRSEEHTSELQSRGQIVCSLLLEKKKKLSAGSSYE